MNLSDVALYSEILPVIFYLCFFGRNKGTGLWVIFLYCLISYSAEAFGSYLPKRNLFYVYAAFTICEYALLTYLMFGWLTERVYRVIILAGSVLFVVVAFYQDIYLREKKIDTLTVSVENILIIIYSILFLYKEITTPSSMYIYDTKRFWVVMAFFLYCSSTLFLFIYAENFTPQEHAAYWIINNFPEILKNILFCIAFTMRENQKPGITVDNPYSDFL